MPLYVKKRKTTAVKNIEKGNRSDRLSPDRISSNDRGGEYVHKLLVLTGLRHTFSLWH